MYGKQKSVEYSPGGVLYFFNAGGNKKISLKPYLNVYLSICNLLLPPGIKGLKSILGIFKE